MNDVARGRDNRALIVASAALVVAIVAVVVAVVGSALAAPRDIVVRKVVVHQGKVKKGDIAPGAVTMKALAQGAVTAKKIRKGAVTAPKLAKASVGPESIAPDAITAGAIAPGSIYGGALGQESIVTKPITDLDAVASNIEWTASNTESALCGPGERVLGGGFAFTNPGNREAAWLQALPVIGGETNGFTGRITTNSGGTASAEVAAICLK